MTAGREIFKWLHRMSMTDCRATGQHMKQIDRDGYCVVCLTRPFEEMAGPESAKILRRHDGD